MMRGLLLTREERDMIDEEREMARVSRFSVRGERKENGQIRI